MTDFKSRLLITALLASAFQVPAHGSIVVRIETQEAATIKHADIRLFDDLTPLSVSNFMSYVDSGDYSNSFFHNSVQNNTFNGLLIQTGRFTFDPATLDGSFSYDIANDVFNGGLQPISERAPVVNEFSKSNTRGTLTVALKPNDPDSFTNAWSINLVDNVSLDTKNGGFTVFGEVLGNGISVFDSIGGRIVFDKSTIHPELGLLALIGYSSGDIAQANLVRINTITPLFSVNATYVPDTVVGDTPEPEDVDFGIVTAGSSLTADIKITNLRATPLTIDAIASTDTLATPYSMLSNDCTTLLALNDVCTISLSFSPQTEAVLSESFNVSFAGLLDYTININGEGSLSPPEPDIALSQLEYNFGDVKTGIEKTIILKIVNEGRLGLNINSFTISGLNENEYSYGENCIANNPRMPGKSCDLQIYFKPLDVGAKTASISIASNDPDEAVVNIALTGAGSLDNDGIPGLIEDMAPNNGDGNNDGIKDSEQSNVLSFVNDKGQYITVVVLQGQYFNNFDLLEESQLISRPANIALDKAYDFRLDNVPVVFGKDVVEMVVLLPADVIPKSYYVYGSTYDNTSPHWYPFLFDGYTGAKIYGKVKIPSATTDTVITRSMIKLIYVDGQRGDSDGRYDGRIQSQGTHVNGGGPSAGTSSPIVLLMLISALVTMRRYAAGLGWLQSRR